MDLELVRYPAVGGPDAVFKAVQAAVAGAQANGRGGIHMPAGVYKFATPIPVPGGFIVHGDGGKDRTRKSGTVIYPATSAFIPSAPTVQQEGFDCANVQFVGGTIPLDLGLRNDVILERVTFVDPSVAALSIVRGERHQFKDTLHWAYSVSSQYGFALGARSVTGLTDIAGVDLGVGGAWADRILADRMIFMQGANNHVHNAIYSDTLSHLDMRGTIFHGVRDSLIHVNQQMQFCGLHRSVIDQCETDGTLLYAAYSLDNEIHGFSGSASANCVYQTAIHLAKVYGTTLFNSINKGDNVKRFGVKFGTVPGAHQLMTINCRGALYSPSKYADVCKQGCNFNPTTH